MTIKKLLILGAFVSTFATITTGCAYRSDLAQGNFIEQEAVDKIRQGMTAEQVRYILGTPMLTDPFDHTRWYYVHYLRQGWDEPKVKNLIIKFSNNLVDDIAGDYQKPVDFYTNTSSMQKITLDPSVEG